MFKADSYSALIQVIFLVLTMVSLCLFGDIHLNIFQTHLVSFLERTLGSYVFLTVKCEMSVFYSPLITKIWNSRWKSFFQNFEGSVLLFSILSIIVKMVPFYLLCTPNPPCFPLWFSETWQHVGFLNHLLCCAI